MKNTALIAFCASLLVVATPGQGAVSSSAAPPAPFVLPAAEHEVASLIDQVAAYLHYNILFAPGELDGVASVRITQRTEVDARGCWELFGSLMYHRGLAVVPLDAERGYHEIISTRGPRARDITSAALLVSLEDVPAYMNLKATPILTTVPLQHIDSAVATNALRPFFAAAGGNPGLTFGTVGNNRTMLVQGFGPQVAAACRLLALADVAIDSGAGRVQVVRLQHIQAEELVATLDSVMGQSIRAVVAAERGAAMHPGSSILRMLPHPSWNAVILTGCEAILRDALQVIAMLDQPAVVGSVGGGAGTRPARRGDGVTAGDPAGRGGK